MKPELEHALAAPCCGVAERAFGSPMGSYLLLALGIMPASRAASARLSSLGRLVEVQPRRRLDAVGAMAEEDLVGVHGDDLVLGVPLLDVDGEQRFLGLARAAFAPV